MNHSIEKLDDCIFDYLVYHVDKPRSFSQIYNDITKDTEIRCLELNNRNKREIYKRRYMTTCHILNQRFEKIHKIYRNDVPYLVYSEKENSIDEIVNDFSNNNIFDDYDINNFDFNELLNYIINDNRDFSDNFDSDYDINGPFDDDGSLLHYLTRNNKIDMLRKFMNLYDVDLSVKDRYDRTPLDVATESNYIVIARELLEYKHNKEKLNLKIQQNDLRKANNRIHEKHKILQMENNKLKKNMYNPTYKPIYIHIFYIVLLCAMFYSMSSR